MTVSHESLAQLRAYNIAVPKYFYPTEIPVQHHQLRRLVSVTEGDLVYYVHTHDIYVLDLRSRQRTLLSTIPFEARCLAAGNGWIGVGGDTQGDCAFIKVDNYNGIPNCFGHDLDVQILGGEIVNSMSIHVLRENPEPEGEPVVLISNNDKTIKMYSLLRREVLTCLEHDVPMNNAALSPDSTVLVTVGDSNRVYFYERRRADPEDDQPCPRYEWHRKAVPAVPIGSPVYDDHSFAVTFSPTGHLCATSSQGGAVTVFDMRLILDPKYEAEEAILCTFRSSRSVLWGCVRSMAFSPPPWDLLAWAEDHGRIGVADVRKMFLRRQILALDKTKAETVDLDDLTPSAFREFSVKQKLQEQHNARMRSMQSQPDLGRSSSLLANSRAELETISRRRQDLMAYHRGLDLDARERSTVEALDTSMEDVQHRTQPYSVNYTTPPRLRPSQAAELATIASEYDIQLLNPNARHGPRVHQPRRRTSVVLSNSTVNSHLAPPEITRTRLSESPGRMSDDDLSQMSTNDLTPTSGVHTMPLPYNIPTSEPWETIQSHLELARRADLNASTADAPTTLAQIEAALEAERALGSQLERQLNDERQLSDLLRRQIETQEELLESQQAELEAERSANNTRLDPSLNHILHRELRSEQQFGEQRFHDLETEMRLGNNRARRLHTERARLLQAAATLHSASDPNPTATTSTLPTTPADHSDTPYTTTNLQRHESFRRQRLAQAARMANLSNSTTNASGGRSETMHQLSTQQARLREIEQQRRDVRRMLHTQAEAHARAQAQAQAQRESRRVPPSAATVSAIARHVSELTNSRTRVTENDRQLANLMFTQANVSGPVGSAGLGAGRRWGADGNGNWVSGGQLQAMYHVARAGLEDTAEREGTGENGAAMQADLLRVKGVGTAGISWGQDGRRL